MNPSYFRIRVPINEAKKRLCKWWGVSEPSEFIETDSVEAVRLACDEHGHWRGGALFFYENKGWTVFEDLTGGFSSVPGKKWLEFAVKDDFVYAEYNDSIPYGELVVIEQGSLLREFIYYNDAPEINVNNGILQFENDHPIQSWIEVASYIDKDPYLTYDKGFLWVNERKTKSDQENSAQMDTNLQRWIKTDAPKQWVAERIGKWGDKDLESLIEELEKTEFWPMNPNHICNILEELTRELENMR